MINSPILSVSYIVQSNLVDLLTMSEKVMTIVGIEAWNWVKLFNHLTKFNKQNWFRGWLKLVMDTLVTALGIVVVMMMGCALWVLVWDAIDKKTQGGINGNDSVCGLVWSVDCGENPILELSFRTYLVSF